MPATIRSLPYVDDSDAHLKTQRVLLENKARAMIFAEMSRKEKDCHNTTDNADTATEPLVQSSSSTLPLHPRAQQMMMLAKTNTSLRSSAATTTSAPADASSSATSSFPPNNSNTIAGEFNAAQRLAIRSEYARSARVQLTAVGEVVAAGIIEDRLAVVGDCERAVRRRRVEVARQIEDINAKRFLLQTCCLVEGGSGKAGEIAERILLEK